MASPTQWTWVWVNSGSWWWTGRPGMLRFMGLQSRTRLSNWTELNWRLGNSLIVHQEMNEMWYVIYIYIYIYIYENESVTQSCLTLCNPIDCSPPGSSVYGLLQATEVGCHFLLQWIFPTQVSCIAGRFFTIWATRKILYIYIVEYYSVIRKNEIMPFAGTLMN